MTPRPPPPPEDPGLRPPEPALRSTPRIPSREAAREHAHPHKGRQGFDRVLHATLNSLEGLAAAYRGEAAFRQEVWAAVVLLPTALWLGRSTAERALLIAGVALVLIVELLNTAVEAAIDRVSYETHDLSKRAKDIASAAVMLSLFTCATLWILVGGARMGWWG